MEKVDEIQRRLKTYGKLDETSKISKKFDKDWKKCRDGVNRRYQELDYYDQGDMFINDEVEAEREGEREVEGEVEGEG